MLSTQSDARNFLLPSGFASGGHLFRASAGAKAAGLAALILLATVLAPTIASAQCAPPTGTVSCTNNPGPQAFTQPPVNEVDYSGLVSNITATVGGQAGASLTSNPPHGTDAPIPTPLVGIPGGDGNDAGAVVIQFAGPGSGFLVSTTDGVGINAQSN